LLTADIPDLSGQYSPVAHAHSFASLTGKPTTLAGYGITDAYPLSSNPAGYLTNNQAITLGGDAGGTGTTSINVVIGARAITAAKFAAINANRLLGRFSAGAGDFEEVSIGANLSLSGAGVLSASAGLVSDTKANVLGLPVNPIQAAYATDTKEILVSDGAAWNLLPFRVVAESANPDMGGSQLSSRVGYGTDYVADKLLSNCLIGYNGKAQAGGFRITSANLLQVYLSAAWQNIPLGVSLRENAAYGQTLEFIPVGTSHYLEIMTGASLGNLAINGLPQTQSFKTSMGGVPYPTRIGGRVI
jgi:hypothetical protein